MLAQAEMQRAWDQRLLRSHAVRVCASQYGPRFTTGLPHKVNGRLSPCRAAIGSHGPAAIVARPQSAAASQAEGAGVACPTMGVTSGGYQQCKWPETAGNGPISHLAVRSQAALEAGRVARQVRRYRRCSAAHRAANPRTRGWRWHSRSASCS